MVPRAKLRANPRAQREYIARDHHHTFLAISDQYATFLSFFHKMAIGGHFGNLIWAILDDRKSLLIAFLAISDQYTTFLLLKFCSKWPPVAILEVPFYTID